MLIYLSGGIQGEANPDAARYTLGYAYLQKENYALALSNFKEVAPVISSQSTALKQDAYVRSADCYFMQKNYSTAKSMYQNVINNGLPQSDYSLYQIALISGINNPAEKIKTFNSLGSTISAKRFGCRILYANCQCLYGAGKIQGCHSLSQ